jgi:hypothetical protein
VLGNDGFVDDKIGFTSHLTISRPLVQKQTALMGGSGAGKVCAEGKAFVCKISAN